MSGKKVKHFLHHFCFLLELAKMQKIAPMVSKIFALAQSPLSVGYTINFDKISSFSHQNVCKSASEDIPPSCTGQPLLSLNCGRF